MISLLRPIVKGITGRKRKGKGFSLKELEAVNLSIEKAKRLKISIDKKRRSAHEENINILKDFIKSDKNV